MDIGYVPQLGDYVGSTPGPLCKQPHSDWDLICNQPVTGHNPEVHVAAIGGVVHATWPVVL